VPERICPMCGRSSKEVPFIGNLCRDCFIKRYGVAQSPSQVEFTYCVSCYAHRAQGRWSAPYPDLRESLRDYVMSQVVPRLRPVAPIQELVVKEVELGEGQPPREVYVRVEGVYEGVRAEEVKVIKVVPRPSLCPVCAARKSGEGYTAVVQLRAYPRPLSGDKEVARLVRRLIESMGDEVVKVEEVKEGLDVYLRDHGAARALATRLRSEAGARIVETFKGGGRKVKLYVSARLATIRPGDVIEVEGRPLFYLTFTPQGFMFIDLDRGGRKVIPPEDLWDKGFKVYEGPNLRRAMVLSKEGGKYVLFWDGGSLEVPSSDVVLLTEEASEGQEFLVYLSQRRVYLLRREA